MSGANTIRMIRAYRSMASPLMFLSGLFESPAENFHSSQEVEIDIIRSDEEVSVVVQSLNAGYKHNEDDLYTNKKFKPPAHKESVSLNSVDLLEREPGQTPFESPDFRANLVQRMFGKMVKIERKIRRAIELQASQILQTGKLDLVDENGTVVYSLDYVPKTTHFSTVGTLWTAGGANPIADLEAIIEIIRNDGLENPDQLIFGSEAWELFITNAIVVQRFETRRIDMGTISGIDMRGNGGNFRGVITIGNYRLDCWSYAGRFNPADGSAKQQYVDPAKVIVRASSGRMDATFGAIPNIGKLLNVPGAGGNLLPELPGRITNSAGSMDLFTNVWITGNGEELMGGVGARPLLIPTAIDTFGCLTVK